MRADRERPWATSNGVWPTAHVKDQSPVAGESAKIDQPATQAMMTNDHLPIVSRLRQFLADALRLPAGTLDVERPLYSLGLDSLIAVELKNHIEETFGVVLPITTFLEEISLAQLAERVSATVVSATETRPVDLASSEQPFTEYPLSYGQQALWLLYERIPVAGRSSPGAAHDLRCVRRRTNTARSRSSRSGVECRAFRRVERAAVARQH
jgi:acyl carrier protein